MNQFLYDSYLIDVSSLLGLKSFPRHLDMQGKVFFPAGAVIRRFLKAQDEAEYEGLKRNLAELLKQNLIPIMASPVQLIKRCFGMNQIQSVYREMLALIQDATFSEFKTHSLTQTVNESDLGFEFEDVSVWRASIDHYLSPIAQYGPYDHEPGTEGFKKEHRQKAEDYLRRLREQIRRDEDVTLRLLSPALRVGLISEAEMVHVGVREWQDDDKSDLIKDRVTAAYKGGLDAYFRILDLLQIYALTPQNNLEPFNQIETDSFLYLDSDTQPFIFVTANDFLFKLLVQDPYLKNRVMHWDDFRSSDNTQSG